MIVAAGITVTLGVRRLVDRRPAAGRAVPLGQVQFAYLIPVAVGGIEAAGATGAAGWTPLARPCLGAGLAGWVAFGSLTLARLLLRSLPPPAQQPTLAIDAAIAAAAGVA